MYIARNRLVMEVGRKIVLDSSKTHPTCLRHHRQQLNIKTTFTNDRTARNHNRIPHFSRPSDNNKNQPTNQPTTQLHQSPKKKNARPPPRRHRKPRAPPNPSPPLPLPQRDRLRPLPLQTPTPPPANPPRRNHRSPRRCHRPPSDQKRNPEAQMRSHSEHSRRSSPSTLDIERSPRNLQSSNRSRARSRSRKGHDAFEGLDDGRTGRAAVPWNGADALQVVSIMH
jgi:hypothetical protein